MSVVVSQGEIQEILTENLIFFPKKNCDAAHFLSVEAFRRTFFRWCVS